MLIIFSTPVLIVHLWQLKTVLLLNWCLIHAVTFGMSVSFIDLFKITFHRLVYTGNAKGGSISVPLTSCLTGLESAV